MGEGEKRCGGGGTIGGTIGGERLPSCKCNVVLSGSAEKVLEALEAALRKQAEERKQAREGEGAREKGSERDGGKDDVETERPRWRHPQAHGGRLVYVCHPYSGNTARSGSVARNVEICRRLCMEIVREGNIPISPQVYLHQFLVEVGGGADMLGQDKLAVTRESAMAYCLALLRECDEIRVYEARLEDRLLGDTVITDGMRDELDYVDAENDYRARERHPNGPILVKYQCYIPKYCLPPEDFGAETAGVGGCEQESEPWRAEMDALHEMISAHCETKRDFDEALRKRAFTYMAHLGDYYREIAEAERVKSEALEAEVRRCHELLGLI